MQLKILRHRQPDGIAIARGDRHGFAFAIFHMLKGEVDVACGVISSRLSPTLNLFLTATAPAALSGELADKLLALGDGIAVFVVLIIVVVWRRRKPSV